VWLKSILYNVGGSWSVLITNCTRYSTQTPFGLVIPLLQSSITRNYNHTQLFLTPLHRYTAYNHKLSWLQSLITLLHTKSPYWLSRAVVHAKYSIHAANSLLVELLLITDLEVCSLNTDYFTVTPRTETKPAKASLIYPSCVSGLIATLFSLLCVTRWRVSRQRVNTGDVIAPVVCVRLLSIVPYDIEVCCNTLCVYNHRETKKIVST
jgi:hypothetical protein